MQRIVKLGLIALVASACDGERAPASDPVDMDTLAWFQEGRTVEHDGARWLVVGPPVYEPLALTRVGEFEGTPLYAERGVASPPRRLYIPVGGGYWQMLERGATELDPAETATDPFAEEVNDTLPAPDP